MEIWDAYDKDEQKIGIDLIRGEEIPDKMFHLVSEVVVRHKDGDFLLLKRDYQKEGYPGYEEIGAGGSVLKNETAKEGALRELKEETGIMADNLIDLYTLVDEGDHSIYHGYLVFTCCCKDCIVLQLGETIGYRWVCKKELISFLDSSQCIPAQKIRLKKYIDSIR